jgi:hypothetical protein
MTEQTPAHIADTVPSAHAALESITWLMWNLSPVASRDVMAHLTGVRDFVAAQFDGTPDG